MSKELEMRFELIAELISEDGLKLYMESMEDYFKNVVGSLVAAKVIKTPDIDFHYDTFDDTEESNYEVVTDEPDITDDGFYHIEKDKFKQIDKLHVEARLAVQTPLLKRDPRTQAMYNSFEQIMALLDDREPNLVNESGSFRLKKGAR